ncbi:MAG TPA: hypothetical protein VK110_11470, partial [Salinisphaeraceae bacterium]|nr:hypothetical protein [Salinisphaeraceae bacterium]
MSDKARCGQARLLMTNALLAQGPSNAPQLGADKINKGSTLAIDLILRAKRGASLSGRSAHLLLLLAACLTLN